jgi:hypothetical protein
MAIKGALEQFDILGAQPDQRASQKPASKGALGQFDILSAQPDQ